MIKNIKEIRKKLICGFLSNTKKLWTPIYTKYDMTRAYF